MSKNILITGGAGFIGVNTARHSLNQGDNVYIFDNFSRKGTKKNIEYLMAESNSNNLTVVTGDIRYDLASLAKLVHKTDIIFHFAGQVAVTTSVKFPKQDFEINALGTINLLEIIRKAKNNPILIYSSTNKVYGNLDYLKVVEEKTRYSFNDLPNGISENCNLDFHSPYGCSKGAADQYIHDYQRIYGLRTIVFRQSCIYGPHQFGVEDQGWVAWFLIALLKKRNITIFGNGKQVRDILYIEDLLKAYDLAIQSISITQGQIYNIGGGTDCSISIWQELQPILERLLKRTITVSYKDWRPGDQKIYISDNRKSKKDFHWEPKISMESGIGHLLDWIQKNKSIF